MQNRCVSSKADVTKTVSPVNNKPLVIQELSNAQISSIRGGAGVGINNRLSLTFNHSETMVSVS
ncbi:MAG: hypothetical protein AAF151_25715 [Cyanobacteria bacterium J06656_5]